MTKKRQWKWWLIPIYAVLGIAVALYVLLPVGMGIVASTRQTQQPAVPPEGYEALTLSASDGIALSAWYAQSENDVAIVLVHGSNGSLDSLRGYAQILHDHGYGVLALCLRGHGSSQGSGNALGWECGKDIQAAMEYLKQQSDIKAIGALGLSLGGEVLLAASGDNPDIHAIISDGATHHTLADYLTLPANRSLYRSFITRVMYASAGLFTGQQPPQATILDAIQSASNTRFLYIAAGEVDNEITYDTMYQAAAPDRSELWIVPDAGHTQAFSLLPVAYETHITIFFDTTLAADIVP